MDTKGGKLTVLVANNNGELLDTSHSRNIHMMSEKSSLELDKSEKLAELVRLDASLARLREKEVELEVDCITAQTALEHTELKHVEGVDVNTAAAIVLTMERRRELSQACEGPQAEGEIQIGQYRMGLSALHAWLEVDVSGANQGRAGAVKTGFTLAVLVVIGVALAVHWAFLILLLPIGATSAMMWSGNDVSWRRVGVQRRFEQSGLSLPEGWTTKAVQGHIELLESKIATLSQPHPEERRSDSTQQLGTNPEETLEEVEQALIDLLGSVGLTDNLDADIEREFRLFSRPFIAKRALADVKSELARVKRRSDQIRDELYRYLQRLGVGVVEGPADTASLTKALARLKG